MSHAGLSPEDLGLKVGQALDAMVQDELLAQAARQQGLKTNLKGSAGRKDLANQYLAQHLSKVLPVDEAALRNFYKNHGEKFVIAQRVQVRELFLPLQSPPDKRARPRTKPMFWVKSWWTAFARGSPGSLWLRKVSCGTERDRAQVHEFRRRSDGAEDERKVLTLKPGEVVGPLRIEGGYSVFQGVRQIRSGRIPFYEARDKIKTYSESTTSRGGSKAVGRGSSAAQAQCSGLLRTRRWRPSWGLLTRCTSINWPFGISVGFHSVSLWRIVMIRTKLAGSSRQMSGPPDGSSIIFGRFPCGLRPRGR